MERGWEKASSWFPAGNVRWAEPCHCVRHDSRGTQEVTDVRKLTAAYWFLPLSSSVFDLWLREVILGAEHRSQCVDLRTWKKATGTKLQAGDEQRLRAKAPEHRAMAAGERDAPQP